MNVAIESHGKFPIINPTMERSSTLPTWSHLSPNVVYSPGIVVKMLQLSNAHKSLEKSPN